MTDISDDSGSSSVSDLEQAPEHIQLAVDLIQLLESNKVDNQVAVAALEIVLSDFKHKLVANHRVC